MHDLDGLCDPLIHILDVNRFIFCSRGNFGREGHSYWSRSSLEQKCALGSFLFGGIDVYVVSEQTRFL